MDMLKLLNNKNLLETYPNLSAYEILFDIEDLKVMARHHREIRRCKIYADLVMYVILLVWGIGGGVALVITGYLWESVRNLSWGIILLIMGIPYAIFHGRYIRRAFFILYEDGVATIILNKKRRIKHGGKRYWFTYIPFKALTDYEIKKISNEFKSLVFYTKDDKVWPDESIGITFAKGKCRKTFAEEVISKFENWKNKEKS